MGTDLPCGAGQVAALERPRRSIHSRSRSIPMMFFKNQNKRPAGRLFLERVMGIEPTSTAWEAVVLPMNYIRVFFE